MTIFQLNTILNTLYQLHHCVLSTVVGLSVCLLLLFLLLYYHHHPHHHLKWYYSYLQETYLVPIHPLLSWKHQHEAEWVLSVDIVAQQPHHTEHSVCSSQV